MSLATPSQSQKRFHQCENHKKKIGLRHPLQTFASFSSFQVHYITHSKEFSGNQGKHPNFDPSILPYKFGLIFMGIKKKKKKFEKKIQNGRLKKSSFFKIANSQNFFAKISEIGPWVSRIEWCEGHWCSSTYVAVRLSDKSSKTAKKYRKCIFWLFLSFCQTASLPYTWSYIDALRIIQTY